MNHFFSVKISYWLRIGILFLGLLLNAAVLNNYRYVGSDLVQDYIAANALRKGRSLYGKGIIQLEKTITGFGQIENFHPPFNALLFWPLSFFHYQTAYISMGIISLVLLLIINLLTVKGLGLTDEWFLNISCFTLLWYPVFYCLGTGQSSMIIAAFIIGGWYCLHLDRTWIAGFLFAVATLMKLFPGLILLYLFFSKNWRALLSTTCFILIGLLTTMLTVGTSDITTYAITIVARNVDEWRGFVLNHSVGGMIVKMFGESTRWTEPLLQLRQNSYLLITLINAVIIIVLVRKIKKAAAQHGFSDFAFALTIISMLLLSPITWGHIFPVLILPLGLLLREYLHASSTGKLRLLMIVLFLLSLPDVLIARKLMEFHCPFTMPWYSMLLTLGPGAGLILLWAATYRHTGKNSLG